jgi:methyl-accepting chemotaxis protein
MSNKNLLILERSSSALKQGMDDKYVLEGVFGELDKKNRNNRIYTAEEYVPQIESLQDKIKASKLLGELDHPSNFDISLKNVSHIIEEITYDEEAKQIKGRIRLLDTDAGRQAKALVDAGVPLQISSRAAGAVESNGTVKIKQLFTYDLVADPGFANAELTRVNESYGFADNSDILIYEISDNADLLTNETKTTENKTITMAESKFITAEDFNKYSQYLSEEIKGLKQSLTEAKETGNETELTNLKEYTTYLAEKLDQTIQYSEHVAEKTDQSIQYSENLSEKLDQSILYTESVASGVNKIKEYTNYLAESYNEGATTHQGLLEYIEYLKENLEKVTEYAEYVAETVNTNLITEEEAGKEIEEIEDENDAKDVTEPTVDAEGNELEHGGVEKDVEKDLELKGEGDAEGEEITEAVNASGYIKAGKLGYNDQFLAKRSLSWTLSVDLGLKASDEFVGPWLGFDHVSLYAIGKKGGTILDDALTDKYTYDELKAAAAEFLGVKEDKAEEIEDEINDLGEVEKLEETNDQLDTYKNEITEKLQSLINKASEKKTNNPAFFNFVSESTQTEFNSLEAEDRTKVLNAVEGRGYLTEGQILGLWKNSLLTATKSTEPNVLSMMPSEYKETFSKLSETKKNSILAQSKMHKLESAYQVANFWQTRDLREVSQVMEKVELITEAKESKKSTIGYDTTDIAAQLAKRFKK